MFRFTVAAAIAGAVPSCAFMRQIAPGALAAQAAGCRSLIFPVLLFLLFLLLPAQAAAESHPAPGRASWYGTTSHGKKTANGEIFSRHALTAAHKTVPFGTVLRVHNLKNGSSVLVRINDRGPFIPGRVVDVSHRAAEMLDMMHSGVVPVELEIVSDKKGMPLDRNNGFYLLAASEDNFLQAKVKSSQLEHRLGGPVHIFRTAGKTGYALCLGPYPAFAEAERELARAEGKEVALLGIIEAPLEGRSLPPAAPPSKVLAASAKLKKKNGFVTQSLFTTTSRKSYKEVLQSTFSFTLEKSILVFDIVKNVIPRIKVGTTIFRLQNPVVSGYIYGPSHRGG